MALELDAETVLRLRSLSAQEILEEARRLAWSLGDGDGSGAYVEVLEALVAAGLLTWAQLDALDDD